MSQELKYLQFGISFGEESIRCALLVLSFWTQPDPPHPFALLDEARPYSGASLGKPMKADNNAGKHRRYLVVYCQEAVPSR